MKKLKVISITKSRNGAFIITSITTRNVISKHLKLWVKDKRIIGIDQTQIPPKFS